jgi:hypothetical protein
MTERAPDNSSSNANLNTIFCDLLMRSVNRSKVTLRPAGKNVEFTNSGRSRAGTTIWSEWDPSVAYDPKALAARKGPDCIVGR